MKSHTFGQGREHLIVRVELRRDCVIFCVAIRYNETFCQCCLADFDVEVHSDGETAEGKQYQRQALLHGEFGLTEHDEAGIGKIEMVCRMSGTEVYVG